MSIGISDKSNNALPMWLVSIINHSIWLEIFISSSSDGEKFSVQWEIVR